MFSTCSNNPTYLSRRNPVLLSFFVALCVIVLAAGTQSVAQVTDLYDFTGGADGFGPNIPIAGPDGSIYGTAQNGGNLNCAAGSGLGCGTVFRLSPSGQNWAFSTLYEFQGHEDGYGYSTLTLDSQGRLYAPTVGGSPWGAIFRLTPRASDQQRWQFDLLYKFTGERDGGNPVSPLFVNNSSGSIFGASNQGGLHGQGCDQQFGCGAIFQLLPPAHPDGAWTSNVLYEFQGANDGGNPSSVVMNSSGIIYGTTTSGGDFNSHCTLGCGVVFELFPVDGTWAYKVLADFKGPHQSPSNLIEDANGNLYGLVGKGSYGGAGDVFELSPPTAGSGAWTLTYLHKYGGSYPATDLILGTNGTVDGSIYGDEDFNWGYVFQLAPPAQAADKWTYTTLANFNPFPYQNPSGIALGLNNYIYATVSGGGYGPGNIVSVAP